MQLHYHITVWQVVDALPLYFYQIIILLVLYFYYAVQSEERIHVRLIKFIKILSSGSIIIDLI